MATRDVTIASAVGLHARPAALFVQAVEASGALDTITKAGRTVAADSILAVMPPGAAPGAVVPPHGAPASRPPPLAGPPGPALPRVPVL